MPHIQWLQPWLQQHQCATCKKSIGIFHSNSLKFTFLHFGILKFKITYVGSSNLFQRMRFIMFIIAYTLELIALIKSLQKISLSIQNKLITC